MDDDAVLDDGEARRAADRIGDAARIVGVPDGKIGRAADASFVVNRTIAAGAERLCETTTRETRFGRTP